MFRDDRNLIYVDFDKYDLEVLASGIEGVEFDIHFKTRSGSIAFEWDLSPTSSQLDLDMHNSGNSSGCANDGTLTNVPVPNTVTRIWKFSRDSSYLYIACDGLKVANFSRVSFFDCLTDTEFQGLGTDYRAFFNSDSSATHYYRLARKCKISLKIKSDTIYIMHQMHVHHCKKRLMNVNLFVCITCYTQYTFRYVYSNIAVLYQT